jgi:protein-S-isoprenylcysteine O-methyltransferase Ste14
MDHDIAFRFLFLLATIAMLVIRVYYQSKILPERRRTTVTGSSWRLIPGGIAALTSIVFGLAYLFFPSAFPWSYADYPAWLRWLGAVFLLGGILLLGIAHHHLGASFHSLVVRKSGQVLVQSGPYRTVRHPIYTAYLLNYVGGGLLASSLVLTFIPGSLFALMVALRISEEEGAMLDQFGAGYEDYMRRTGRFVPPLRSLLRPRHDQSPGIMSASSNSLERTGDSATEARDDGSPRASR